MRPTSRLPQFAVALLFICALLASLVYDESAKGRIHGTVTAADSGRPLAHARVVLTNLDSDADAPELRVRTDAGGAFSFQGVPVGLYSISASTRAHGGTDQTVFVAENDIEQCDFDLTRSQPDLEIAPVQSTFAPTDKITVPVRGYVIQPDASVHLTLYRGAFSDFMRVPALAKSLQAASNRYATSPAGLTPDLKAHAHIAAELDVPVAHPSDEGFFDQNIALPISRPGLYLMDAEGPGDKSGKAGPTRACDWILVTDSALVLKYAAKNYTAYVANIADGTPRAGAVVTLYRDGQFLTQQVTDAQGLAHLPLPASATSGDNGSNQDSSGIQCVARYGDAEALLGQGGYNDESADAYTVATYTDRTIYRPGDTLFYKGIVRLGTAGSGRYTVPAGQSVHVELRDPDSQVVTSADTKVDAYGAYWGSATLSGEAATGSYTLVTNVDGEEHTADVTVAAYRKPEMTATVTMSTTHASLGSDVPAVVEAHYYSGSPVAGAGVDYEIYKETDWEAEYPDELGYDEDDQADASQGDGDYGEIVRSGSGVLDKNGRLTIHMATSHQKDDVGGSDDSSSGGASSAGNAPPPQAEIWTVHVTITDSANRTVEARGSSHISAGDFTLGLEPDGDLAIPGTNKNVTILARDLAGNGIPGQKVALTWGYLSTNPDTGDSVTTPAGQQDLVTGAGGLVTAVVNIAKSGELQLTVTGQDNSGDSIEDDTTIWVAGDSDDTDGVYDSVTLLTDKHRYLPGETASVLLNVEKPGGAALLTIEGDRVYRAWVVPLSHHSVRFSLPILAEYGPNVEIDACVIVDGTAAYGETPLRVDLTDRAVQVEVKPDAPQHLPGENVAYDITTKDRAGHPVASDFSLSVVDEGIYALAADDPHRLRDIFYPRRDNAVETTDSTALTFLGDVSKDSTQIKTRRRFVDTAYWLPNGRTDASGHAHLAFNLPDNLTQWRATVWAQTLDSSFGYGIAPVVVTKPLFVRLDRPRFAVVGDTLNLTTVVHNGTGTAEGAQVELDAPGLQLSGGNQQTVQLDPGQDATLEWPVTVTGSDPVPIRVSTWTSGHQYTDALEETLPVEPFGREKVVTDAGNLANGTHIIHFQVPDGAKNVHATLRVVPSPLAAFSGAFTYLLGYPYGCTEQTTSRMMPDLLALRLAKTGEGAHLFDAKTTAQLPQMVRDAIVRLRRFQHSSGAWGWWQFDDDDPYLTGYALSALAMAKQEGFEVPDDVLKNGREAAIKLAGATPTDAGSDYDAVTGVNNVPFLLYAAAQAGARDDALAAAADIVPKHLDAYGLSYLILLEGSGSTPGFNSPQPKPVQLALDDLASIAHHQNGYTYWSDQSGQNDDFEWDADWDDVTSTALALRALAQTDDNDPRIPDVLRFLMGRRTGGYWDCTRDTAEVLNAFTDYLQHQTTGEAEVRPEIAVSLNGSSIRSIDTYGNNETLIPLSSEDLAENDNQIQISGGDGLVSYSFDGHYTTVADHLVPIASQGVTITRTYLHLSGTPGATDAPSDDEGSAGAKTVTGAMNQGDSVWVRLTITTPRDLGFVLVEDHFAAGCEPNQLGSADVDSADEWGYWWDATDVQDDRIAFFSRHLNAGTHTFEYNLKAQTPGSYRVVPAIVTTMYAPALRAETGNDAVRIVPAQ